MPPVRTLCLFLLLAFSATLAEAAQAAQPAESRTDASPNTDAIAHAIDAYFAPLASSREVSGTLRIEWDGQPLVERNYGYADWARRIPHTGTTRFHAGSVTKGILAATLVQLARDATIGLDDPLERWLPSMRAWPEMTIRAVLHHRAGLPREFPDGFDPTRSSVSQWLAEAPERVGTPGKERYSDVGYALLAELIEAVTERSFAEVVRERVLRPAGMRDSAIAPTTGPSSRHDALPYTPGPEPSGVMTAPAAPAEVGSAGLVTTAADLARWVRHLGDGAYPELFEGDDPLGSIDVGVDANGRYVAVQGTLPGYVANAVVWPERKLVASYTGNLFSAPALDLGDTLRALVGPEPPPPPAPRPAAVPLTDAHRELVGDHSLPGFGNVRIECDRPCKQMRLSFPGKPAHWSFHLTPIADGALHWRAFDRRLRSDGAGGVTAK